MTKGSGGCFSSESEDWRFTTPYDTFLKKETMTVYLTVETVRYRKGSKYIYSPEIKSVTIKLEKSLV